MALVFSAIGSNASFQQEKSWRETAMVPIGSSFAMPYALANAIDGTGNKIKVSAPTATNIALADFLKTGRVSDALEPFVQETSDIRYLDNYLAASLGYLSASASASNNTIVVVEQWRKFIPITIDVADPTYLEPEVTRFPSKKGLTEKVKKRKRTEINAQLGFSMSIVTRIDAAGANVNLGQLIKSFTAGFQFERFSATSNTEIIGLSSSKITDGLPSSIVFIQAQADAGQSNNPAEQGRLRHQAMVRKMAEKFEALRKQAWKAPYTRPMLIGIDLDGMERLTGTFYQAYGDGRR